MVIASGVRTQLSYIKEVTRGVTPAAPAMKILRATDKNPNLEKDLVESTEVGGDRMPGDSRHGFNRVGGGAGFAFSREAYDDFLEFLLGNTFAAGTSVDPVGAGTGAAGSGEFTRASGSFITDGYRVGDIIVAAGFTDTNINAEWRVTAVSALLVTVYDPTDLITVEAAGGGKSIDLKGTRLDHGTSLDTITLERSFLDLGQHQPLRGVSVNEMSLRVAPNDEVGGNFSFLGMSGGAITGTSVNASLVPAPTNKVFASFDGTLWEGGAINAIVTGIDLTISGNRTVEGVVGSKFSPDVFDGQNMVEGTITAFLQDASLWNKFFNETESSLWLKLNDPDGVNFLSLVLPRIVFNGGEMDPPQEGPVPIRMPFRALKHATYGTNIWWQTS